MWVVTINDRLMFQMPDGKSLKFSRQEQAYAGYYTCCLNDSALSESVVVPLGEKRARLVGGCNGIWFGEGDQTGAFESREVDLPSRFRLGQSMIEIDNVVTPDVSTDPLPRIFRYLVKLISDDGEPPLLFKVPPRLINLRYEFDRSTDGDLMLRLFDGDTNVTQRVADSLPKTEVTYESIVWDYLWFEADRPVNPTSEYFLKHGLIFFLTQVAEGPAGVTLQFAVNPEGPEYSDPRLAFIEVPKLLAEMANLPQAIMRRLQDDLCQTFGVSPLELPMVEAEAFFRPDTGNSQPAVNREAWWRALERRQNEEKELAGLRLPGQGLHISTIEQQDWDERTRE